MAKEDQPPLARTGRAAPPVPRQGSYDRALSNRLGELTQSPRPAAAQTAAPRYDRPGAVRPADRLRLEQHLPADIIAQAEADLASTTVVNPLVNPPSDGLIARLGPAYCARHALLPWRSHGAGITVLSARPDEFPRHLEQLESAFGPVRMGVATEDQIHRYLQDRFGTALARDAETCTPLDQSCRKWSRLRPGETGLLCLTALLTTAAIAPLATFVVFLSLAMAGLMAFALLRLGAALVYLNPAPGTAEAPAVPAHTPVISLLVPLFREAEITSHLQRHLRRLDYPRACLDILLVLEASDQTTRAALARTALPGWVRVIVVPDGKLRTKPRALNYALNFARGSIIGVYDAEDAPAPDQLRRVAEAFAWYPPQVACLQGRLDYYNSADNWLARCFTVEYATWFRVMLPGLARMRLPVPLGGTTLFFRRDTLESLGGWDAHNVTEDADLGIRLTRAGYRTELIDTVTGEEANNRLWPWIRQRSRWLKGYALTYGVHMSRPLALWRDLGTWSFLGFQAFFLGALLPVVLAPVLWSFWLLAFGLPHPLEGLIPRGLGIGLMLTFIAVEISTIALGMMAVATPERRWLIKWVPTLHLYFLFAAVAAWKALFEVFARPFYWDKTTHGRSITGG